VIIAEQEQKRIAELLRQAVTTKSEKSQKETKESK
jgi:hypothetical protein